MFIIDPKAPWLEPKMVGVAEGAVHRPCKKTTWCEYHGRRYLVGSSAFDNRLDAEAKRLKTCQQLVHSHLRFDQRKRAWLVEAILKLKAEVNGVNN